MLHMSGGRLKSSLQSSIREIVFGTEDSLVSTLGAVTGIAAGIGDSFVVILSGIVLIFVESVSMAAGSYLSSKSAKEVFESRMRQESSRILQERVSDDESVEEMLKRKKFSKTEIKIFFAALSRERKLWMREIMRQENKFAPGVSGSPLRAGIIMGAFYLFAGIFPLVFYFFLPVQEAIIPSIILTGCALFVLGSAKARIANVNWWRSSLEMVSVSLTAAALGFIVGRLVSLAFGVHVF